MNRSYYLLCLFGTLTCFLPGNVAHEAITGGNAAKFADFLRYQVTILIDHMVPFCGGGIVKNMYILTAAHCLIGHDHRLIGRIISIKAGTRDLNKTGTIIGVETVFVPEEYTPWDPNHYGDIAVLKLRTHLDLHNDVLYSKLSVPRNTKLSYDNKKAKIAGFGWDRMHSNNHFFGYRSDTKLHYAVATVQNLEQCRHEHSHDIRITEKHICAKVQQPYNDHDLHGTCFGDAGSPLVTNGKLVIGILAAPPLDCSEKYSSGVYTSTIYYRKFITSALGNEIKNMVVYHL